ncbi:DUF4097 family beta strand repeat-containing protein [Rhodohalobacter sp.]|uniref:DUF4097 family beta strand repeat-containing protein n=1 Tax=Rhodohalobacter sp. TaxID=1974210 RepID=UPI002ACE5F50|nr:DUF4097 family beta strand repeat-containing protein [Rhodohalobacter sp.]MDZ7757213.1 DUF4097 family beta strand repeat-containing protein [Rhodohalobacter sp.]
MEQLTKFLICLFATIIAFFSSLTAQNIDDAYRTEIFNVNDNPTINIQTSGGSIMTEGHNEDEVRVYMIVRRGNRALSPSDFDLDDFEIDISQDGNTITARAERKNSGFGGWFSSGNNVSISFVVQAPAGSFVDGSTSGGSVTARNFMNDVSLRTSGGSVTAESIRGNADLRTSGGSINLADVHGTVNGRTSGGSIRVDGLTGPADLRTSGGSIRLENVSGEITARTSGGSIRAQLTEFSDDLDLRTSGGSISVDIPETEHFEMDLSGNRVNVELRNFTGSSERDRVEGTIGNGGPMLAARTSGGSVTVNYN